MKRLAKRLRYLFLLVGAGLLTLLIRKIGVQTIFENIEALGWWIFPILCISACGYILYTAGWMQFLNRAQKGIHFWELFRIKITGEAVNTLTPANFIGGDPMRIYLLKKNFPVSKGAASVVVDRTLHSVATLIMILFGIIVAFFTFEHLSANIKYGVPIALIVSITFMGFILIHQRRGLFGLLLNFCRRVGIKRDFSERTIKRFMELDEHIVDFYQDNHRGFLIALCCHIVGRLLGVVEIYAIGYTVDANFSLFAALMLGALAPMVNMVFAFVPGALGIMEGAFSGMLYLMHFDPAVGITIQIAKRIRSAFWIALGLLFMGAHERRKVWDEQEMIEEVEQLST